MASLSRQIRRAHERKTRHSSKASSPDTSRVRLQNLGIGVGCALVLLTIPATGQAQSGFTQQTLGNTTTFQQTADKVFNKVPGYNIGIDQTHLYNQPGASSIFVQRVTGADPSSILGQLIANGQVWVMNPGGVIIGSQASVNTAGFMATSLVMGEDDFFAGRYTLKQEGQGGFVINNGTITVNNGGYAILAGGSVVNNGYIRANMGEVVLASGRKMTMDFTGDGLINFAVDEKLAASITGPNGAKMTTGVLNAGTIRADGGRVVMTGQAASGILDAVVNNTGVIEARSVVERNGEIILLGGNEGLVKNSGTLDVSSDVAQGGTIKVLGEYVGLFDAAKIDASGATGGGTVLIGGNFQGAGPEANAFRTYVSKDATITADAITSGDGGKVVVWADDATRFYGNISAKGGALSGDGGFVEVSGKRYLDFDGLVNTLAANGQAGTLLLDPTDITVTSDATAESGLTDKGTLPNFYWDASTTNLGTSTIKASTIVANLETGNVTLDTAGGSGVAGQGQDITVASAIIATPGKANKLTLLAGEDIIINAAIDMKDGDLDLRGGQRDNITSGAITATVSVTANNLTAYTDGTITMTNLSVNTADLKVNQSGVITLSNNKALTVKADSNVLGTNNGDISITTTAGGNLTVDTINAGTGVVTLTSAGTINELTDNLTPKITAGSTSMNATTGIGIASQFDVNIPTLTSVTTKTGGINLRDTAATTTATSVTTTGAGNITLDAAGAIILTNVTAANGAITVTAAGTVTASNVVSATDNDANDITITTTAGNINVGSINAGGAAGDVTLTANTVAGQSVLAPGVNQITADTLTVTAEGDIGTSAKNLSTTLKTLVASSTGAGGIYIIETDGLAIGTTSTTAGAIGITAGGAITTSGNITAAGGALSITGLGITVSNQVAGNANGITLNAGSGTFTVNTGTVNVGATAGDITVVADTMVLDNGGGGTTIAVDTGTVTLKQSTAGRTIGIAGGAGNLALTAGDMYDVQTGATGKVVVGDVNSGNIILNALSPNYSLELVNGGANSITVAGAYDSSAAGKNLTIDSGTGGIAINTAMVSLGTGAFTASDAVTLGANLTVSATGGATFASTINADVAANNRTLDVQAGAGTVTFAGNIGGLQALADLDVKAATINLNGSEIIVNAGAGGNTVTFDGAAVLGSGLAINTDGVNDNDIDFAGTLNGAKNLILTAGTGTTIFTGAVGNTAAVGSGTGAAIMIVSGTTTFNETVKTASGIISDPDVIFKDNVTIAAGDTETTLTANTTLGSVGASMTFESAGNVTFGGTGADRLTLAAGATGITLKTTGTGTLTFEAKVDGGVDLTLNTAGNALFKAAVGSVTPIGDGTGAALVINSSGQTIFNSTLGTDSGITQHNDAGAVTFRDNVTIAAGDTETTFNANVILDGLNFTSEGDVTFGDAATDTVTLSGNVYVGTSVNGTDQTYKAAIDGNFDLDIDANLGNVVLGEVGQNVPLTYLIVFSNVLTLNGSIAVTGVGSIDLFSASAITVANDLTIGGPLTGWIELAPVTIADDKFLTVGSGAMTDIYLNSVMGTDGGASEALTVSTQGAIVTSGAIGNGKAGNISTVTMYGEDATKAALSITTGGDITVAGTPGGISLRAASIDIDGDTIDSSADATQITFITDTLITTGGASVTAGTGTFQIAPSTTTNTIGVYQATQSDGVKDSNYDLDMTVTAGSFIIGSAQQTGAITVDSDGVIGFLNNLTMMQSLTGTGSITFNGGYTSAGKDLTLIAGTGGIAIGGIATDPVNVGAGTVTMTSGGAITQVAGAELIGATLTAKTVNNAAQAITLTDADNNFATVNLSTRNAADNANVAGAISYRDTNDFDIGAEGINTAGNATLNSTGTVTQTGIITAAGLELLGADGTFTLNTQDNAITTLAGNTGTVEFQDNTGFAIGTVNTGGLTATVAATLTSPGTVTQSAAITTPTLTLTGANGTFNLGTQNNAVTTLDANNNPLVSVNFRDDNGFDVAGINATGAVSLDSAGAVTQSALINATTLTLLGTSAATGAFDLGTQINAVTTLDADTNQLASVIFRDDTGFDVAGINASGIVTLDTADAVTQTAAIAGTTLTLQNTTAAGTATFNLGTSNNDVTTLDANNNTLTSVSFRDDNGFAVAGIDASGAVSLDSAGAVTQSALINATTLTLLGTGGNTGAFNLGTQINAVTTLDADTNQLASVIFRDDTGFAVAGINATGIVTLDTAGAVTQSAAIAGTTLTLQNTSAAGTATFNLGTQNNAVTTLDANNNPLVSVNFRDDNGFDVAGINATGAVSLDSAGAVTQSALINATTLTLLGTSAATGAFDLGTQINAVTTLDADTNQLASVIFRDDTGFAVAGINATGIVTLDTAGAVTQSAAIAGTTLTLQNTSAAGTATFNLGTQNNAVTTLDAYNNPLVSVNFRDDNGFAVAGITASGAVTLDSNGAVTQTAAITGTTLTLLDTAGALATYNLGTSNNDVTTLDANNNTLTTVIFRDDNGFDVAGINVTGNATLNAGAVTQSDDIIAAGLELLGTGSYTLTRATNNIATLAGNVDGAVSYTDADAFTVGTVNMVGLTTTGGNNIVLTTPGLLTIGTGVANEDIIATGATIDINAAGVTENAVSKIIAANLRLQGTGVFNIASVTNNVGTIAAATNGAITYVDADDLIIGSVLGTDGVRSTGDIVITAGGDLTVDQIVASEVTVLGFDATAQSGNITLSATGGDMFVNANIYSQAIADGTGDVSAKSGDVTLTAGGDITLDNSYVYSDAYAEGGDTATATAGAVTLTAGSGSITLDNSSVYSYAYVYEDSGSRSVSAESGAVTLTAGGSITLDNNAYVYSYAQSYVDDAADTAEAKSGAVTLTADADISSNDSYIYSEANAFFADSNTAAAGQVLLTAAGDITIDNGSKVRTLVYGDVGQITAGNITIDAGGSFWLLATTGNDARVYTQADGAITITARTGEITLAFGTVGVTSDAGTVTLIADNMNIAAAVGDGTTGLVTLKPYDPAQDIQVGVGAVDNATTLGITNAELNVITSTGGLTIGSNAQTGNITVVGVANPAGVTGGVNTLQSDSGDINVNATFTSAVDFSATSASGNINFGAIGRIDAGVNNVFLNTDNGAIEGDIAVFTNVIANQLVAEAGNGIGSTNTLETQVNAINLWNESLGNIAISNTGSALTIDDFNIGLGYGILNEAVDGKVTITNDNSISIPGTSGKGIQAESDISLTASGGTSDITAGGGSTAIESLAGNVTINAGQDVSLGAGGDYGDVYTSGAGTISITAGRDVIIDNYTYVESDSGKITIDAQKNVRLLATTLDDSAIKTDGGNISVTARNGEIEVSAKTGVDSNSGNVSLMADNMILAGYVDASASTVTLKPYNTGTTIDVGGGDGGGILGLTAVELNTITAKNLLIGGATTGDGKANIGAISITADTNPLGITETITLQNTTGGIAIVANLTAPGNLALTTTGGITRTSGTLAAETGKMDLSAATKIGTSLSPIYVSVSASDKLTAVNSTLGDIALYVPNPPAVAGLATDLYIGGPSGASITNNAPNGGIYVTTQDGFINVSAAGTGVSANGAGNIDLQALGSGILTTDAPITTGTGTINLFGNQGVIDNVGSTVTTGNTGATAIQVTANNNDITMNAGTVYTGGAGSTITILADNNINLGRAVAPTGTVDLTATNGSILDINGATNNVTATTLTATAANKIGNVLPGNVITGPTNAIETAVSNLTVTTTNAGVNEIAIDNTSAASLVPVLTLNGGGASHAWVRNSGDLDVSALTMAVNNNYGFISTNGSLTVQAAAINIGAGILNLQAATAGQDVVRSGGGNITVTADDFLFKSGSTEILATTVSRIDATVNGAGNDLTVNETDGVTVTDLDTDTYSLVAANNLTLNTNAATVIDYRVNAGTGSATINVLAAGDLDVAANANAEIIAGTIVSVDVVDGNINFATAGAGDGYSLTMKSSNGATDITVSNPAAARAITFGNAGAISDVSVTAIGGDINVVNNVVLNPGSIRINKDAAITAYNLSTDPQTGTLNITGDVTIDGSVIVRQGRTINFSGQGADIVIGPTGFTGSGNLTLDPGGFNVDILSGGKVTVNAGAGTEGDLTIVNADFVTMQTGSSIVVDGGVSITALSDVTLQDVKIDADNAGLARDLVVSAGGDIILNGRLDANSNGGGSGHANNVSLTAGGYITDGNLGAMNIDNVTNLTLNAGNGIGYDGITTDALEINALNIQGILSGAGNIALVNIPTGDVTLGGAAFGALPQPAFIITGGGDISYEQVGKNLTIAGVINSNGGNIVIDPPFNVDINADIISGGGNIVVEADNNINVNAGNLISGGGDVRLSADMDRDAFGDVNFTVAGGGAGMEKIQAGAGTITLEGGNIILQDWAVATTGTANLTAGRMPAANGTIIGVGTLPADPDIQAANINVYVTSTAGGDVVGTLLSPLNVNPTAVLNVALYGAGAGNVFIGTTGALPIGEINVDADATGALGNVSIDGTNGAITNANLPGMNVTANTLTITGNGLVGAVGTPVSTQVTNVALTTGNSYLSNTGALNINASTVTGDLGVVTSGAITDGGVLTVTGTSIFNAGANTITLDNANMLTGAVSLTGTDVSLRNDMATDIGTVTATNLNIDTATGGGFDITNSGAIVVTGTTTVDATAANNITLGNAANDFGTLVITSGNNVSINDINGIVLGALTVSGTLDIMAAGNITDTGNISVGGLATFNAGLLGNIILGDGAVTTNFGQLNVTGSTITITEDSDTELTGVNATSSITLTTTGNITDVAGTSISVAGTGRFTATGDITLGDNPGDTINFGRLNVSGVNVSITEDSATILTGVTATTFSLTSSGSITDAPGTTMAVTGLATFNSGANQIDLGVNPDTTTDFGSLNLTGGAVRIMEDSATELAGVNVAKLTLTSTGAITQTGTITAGATKLSGTAITLNMANTFGDIEVTSTGVVSITEAAAMTLGNIDTGANALTLNAGANAMSQIAGATVTSGQLDLTGGAITLANGGNTFGAITVSGSTSANIAENAAMDIAGVASTGAVTLSSTGAIAQTGAIAGTMLTTGSVGGTVLNSANTVTAFNATNTGGGNIEITNTAAPLDITGVSQAGGGNLIIGNTGAVGISGAVGTGGGNTTITATGAVTQTAPITTNLLSVTTKQDGGAAINLANAGNDAVTINLQALDTAGAVADAGAITYRDATGVDIARISTTSTADITTAGNITQSGAINAGATTLTAGAGNNITLGDLTNDFTGVVTIVSGNDVVLTDANALSIGASTVSGNLTTTGLAGTVDFAGATKVGGNLTATAVGVASDITQSVGSLTVVGVSTLNAGQDIILANVANDFTFPVSLTSGRDATIVDANSIILMDAAVGGDLAVTAVTGDISQINAVNVTGTATLTAGKAIILTQANEFLGAVSLNNSGANNVAITDATALDFGASSIGSGTFTVVAGGAITQTGGAFTQAAGAGATSFTAAGFPITLTDAANEFTGEVSLTGAVTQITDVNALNLGVLNTGNLTAISTGDLNLGRGTVAGNLSATSNGGAVTQDAGLIVTGTTMVNAGASTIALGAVGNDFMGAVSLNNSGANFVIIRDINALIIDTSNIGAGSLTVSALGVGGTSGITQIGAITQAAGAGAASFNADAGAITLTLANEFTGPVSLSNTGANAIQVTDATALELGTVTTANDLTVIANGAITQTGGGYLSIGGTTNLTAGVLNDITLSNATNNFVGAVSVVSSNNATLRDANDIILDNVNAITSVTLTAAGSITENGDATADITAATANLTATAGSINLETNVTTLAFTAGDTVTVTEVAAGGAIIASGTAVNSVNIATQDGSVTVGAAGISGQGVTLTAAETAPATVADVIVVGPVNAVAGQLVVTAADSIIQTLISGTLTTTGNATLTATTGSITGNATLITANVLIATAATGINVNTVVTSVTATTTGIGGISITESDDIVLTNVTSANGAITVTAGGALTAKNVVSITDADANDITILGTTIGAGVINAGVAGDVFLTATAGAITDLPGKITADQVTASAAGAMTLDTTATEILSATTSAPGAIIITETDGIILTNVNSNNGFINVTAGGAVTATKVISTTDADANDITIQGTTIAAGIINAGAVGDVFLTATGGAITDLPGKITADVLTATAAGAMTLDTTVSSVDATTTVAAGAITIAETDGLNIIRAAATVSGAINITTAGATDVLGTGNGVYTNGADPVTITVNGGNAGILTVNREVISKGGAVTLTAANNAIFGVNGDIFSNGGNISVTADNDGNSTGSVTMANGTLFRAGAGTVTINSYGDIALGQIDTTNATTKAVTLTTTSGAVIDANGEDMNVIANAGRLVISSVTGVGSVDALETQVGFLDITNKTSGNINISESDAVTIVRAVQTAPGTGNIRVIAGGTITVDDLLAADNTVISTQGAGTVMLHATGVASNIVLNDGISTVGGNITLAADNNITMGKGGDITTSTGNVMVIADADAYLAGAGGSLTMADGAVITAGTGTITVNADGDVTLGSLQTANATANAIRVTSTSGGIVDGGDTNVDIISSGGGLAAVTLKAATGIGAANGLEMSATTISGDTTTGRIDIDNTSASNVLVRSLTTGSGDILFDQTGGGNITFTVVRTDSGSAYLTNTHTGNSPNITVGDITASNLVDIRAKGSIFNDGIAGTDIKAPRANLVATNGTIGVWNMPVEVDVNDTLYVNAGGTQDGWLSVSLQGRDVYALRADLSIPGLVLFNNENPGAPLSNGTVYYFNNVMTNKFFEAMAQNKASNGNELSAFELFLDIFGDAIYAPYADLMSFADGGVRPNVDENEKLLKRRL